MAEFPEEPPEEHIFDDEPLPLSEMPRTGLNGNIMRMWIFGLIISLMIFGLLCAMIDHSKKKSKKKK